MNHVGVQTLFKKEVRRFFRVPGQTVLAPLVSTALYFLIFGYSLGKRVVDVEGMPYLDFIVPGLVFTAIANNAFLNSSSSLFITKIQGTIVDLLVAPLGPTEILVGFIGGAMVRGLLVGLLTWATGVLFAGLHLEHLPATLLFLLLSSYVFSVLGLLAAMWADKFEQINFFPTFVMLPLTFLGGIFYSVNELPSPWRELSLLNPMVYMVDGIRYGMLGKAIFPPSIALAMLVATSAVATAVAFRALQVGYKLRT